MNLPREMFTARSLACSGGAVQAAGALLLGFISYGTSILLYVYSQRTVGAATTATYYTSAPFTGAGISFFVFRQFPT